MGAWAVSKSRYGEGCRSDRGQGTWHRHKRVPWEHERPVEVLRRRPEWSPPVINDQATEPTNSLARWSEQRESLRYWCSTDKGCEARWEIGLKITV